jgi:surfeit locus 1 family protein
MSPRSRFVLPALLAVVALVCIRLGVWQLHRLAGRRAANRAALAARSEPELDLAQLADTAGTARLANRRVRAVGQYDRIHEIVLRGVSLEEAPGVQVVTPLRLPGGVAVLVKRGFVPAPDAVSADLSPLDEPGQVQVHGIALPIESSGRPGLPLTRDGRTTWARLELDTLRRLLPYPLLGVYLLQAADSGLPGFPRRLDVPQLDDGPHLSYAIQWFGFAATALIVGGIVAFRSPARGPHHRAPR